MTPSAFRARCTVALLAAGLAASPAALAARQAVIVAGTIVDRVNGEAIAGATVVLDDTRDTVVTGADGRFRFVDLPVGNYLMRFSGPGYAPREDTLVVMRPGSIDVRVLLTPAPYELDPIGVEATRSPFLVRTGFYERRDDAGLHGVFLDRAEIVRRQAKTLTDLFHGIPGSVVRSQSMGSRLIRFNRNVGGDRGMSPDGCIPDMYVDGLVTGGRPGYPRLTDHDVVDVWHVEAVEVYVGANTPIQYKSDCGVILVWTRHR